ncbi:class I SAM-dependent DNA methyltransferase [Corynebacterium durum]|uniref:type I restriction-modification system subunit M n=1 Tax=Corynebacterium durum TaxID=61592 RepID=UPI0028ED7FB4|nr:class I SAM-dependent DNA methyltransferase [Corynebacterium durum]
MITGSLKNQIDRVWDTFWSGGISNPMDVIEQFTYLLFIRQLDEQQNQVDKKRTQAKILGITVHDEENIFTPDEQDLRWKNLMQIGDPEQLHTIMVTRVFPFFKTIDAGTLSAVFQDATFGINSPSTLRKAMELINEINIKNRDITGDLYEYMLSKLAVSGTNGQFRTPQHIIDLLVELMEPQLGEKIIDPACGTAGFLINAAEWMKLKHKQSLYNTNTRQKFYDGTFTGYDFDRAMNRIATMNSYMHGFNKPNISYRDSLSELPAHEHEYYDIVLANPPFAGSLDAERVDPAIRKIANTKKTELLFLARFLTLLKVGGRAAVIVPEGVLFGSTKAHKALRQELVENQKLDAVIKLPSGVFKPYSGVSTAVLCFTKTDSGGTDEVWFYDMLADGRSLDDKRTALLPDNLLGPAPYETVTEETPFQDPTPVELTTEQLEKNNLPDLVARFRKRNSSERDRKRTDQSFTVNIEDIRDTGYELSMNRYKEIVFEDEETRDPQEILDDIAALDGEIAEALAEVRNILGGTR